MKERPNREARGLTVNLLGEERAVVGTSTKSQSGRGQRKGNSSGGSKRQQELRVRQTVSLASLQPSSSRSNLAGKAAPSTSA